MSVVRGVFTTKHTKATKVSENDISKLLNFVFFVPPSKIWLGVGFKLQQP